MTITAARIQEWVQSCKAGTGALTPAQTFEQSIRDMRHAGYRLPAEIVAGVRAALDAP